jgi:hypothetical protein
MTRDAVSAIMATVSALSTHRRAIQMLNDHANNQTRTSSAKPVEADCALVNGEAIGTLTHVGGTTATVSISADLTSPTRVRDLLAILSGPTLFLSEVLHLETRDLRTHATLSLLATVDLTTLTLTQGVSRLPLANSPTYRPSVAVIKAHLEARSSLFEDLTHRVAVELGFSHHCPAHTLSFSPEKLFGRHCAVLGTSGSGKSWSLARLMEECARLRGKAVLIDPSGEYRALTGPVRHLHFGDTPSQREGSTEVSLPYYQLTEADLVAILQPGNATQLTKLKAAIRSLKILAIDPRLGVDGNLPKAHRHKMPFEMTLAEYHDEVCQAENAFNIHHLPMQIGLECVDPIRSQIESNYWGGMNATDHNECVPLISKLEGLLQSRELDAILRPTQAESLLDEINHFLSDQSVSILRISCEYLPTINRVREIVSNALGRHLLGLAGAGQFASAPLVVCLDEAHQMLPKTVSALSNEYPLEAFNVIAKEGRKYGLTLCIATQRPRDIPDDVLSQVGTFIVHRLVSDADRTAVERASGGINQPLNDTLPVLAPGEAFLLGVDFPNPLRLNVERPSAPPESSGPDYQASWGPATVQ